MKINVYVNGVYAYSTNKHKACKEAIAELKQKKSVEVASIPSYKISVDENDTITGKRIKK